MKKMLFILCIMIVVTGCSSTKLSRNDSEKNVETSSLKNHFLARQSARALR